MKTPSAKSVPVVLSMFLVAAVTACARQSQVAPLDGPLPRGADSDSVAEKIVDSIRHSASLAKPEFGRDCIESANSSRSSDSKGLMSSMRANHIVSATFEPAGKVSANWTLVLESSEYPGGVIQIEAFVRQNRCVRYEAYFLVD